MSTPHINAAAGDFAKTVIMPGDPLRAAYIAEKYLSDARLVNNVRGVQGRTGTYKGRRLSVMASGMGMPSMAIYAHELFEFYGVENIIRTGSAGALSDGLQVRDVFAAEHAVTDSNPVAALGCSGGKKIPAHPSLLRALAQSGADVKYGGVFTSDIFYAGRDALLEEKALADAVDMETAMLYATAKRAGKKALAIFTVSDRPLTGEGLSADERERTFDEMIKIALDLTAAI